jgi:hypothetical protein
VTGRRPRFTRPASVDFRLQLSRPLDLGLALPFIKSEMASGHGAGLVSGLAFVLCYSLIGVPIACC